MPKRYLGHHYYKIELVEIPASADHRYYRKNNTHYVPKVRVEDLIIK